MIEKNDLSFGTDKIISVASMYYKEDTSNSDDDYMRTYNVMRLGDIAFEGNKSKNFAHGRFVENTIGDGIVSHVFDVFRPISEYDLLFWKYFINYEGVMGRIMIRCTKASTMMTNLVAKDFLEESIVVPSIVEQKRIGYYLKSLDHLITLHQSKSFEYIFKAIVNCTLYWEQRKLGEIGNTYSGLSGKVKDDFGHGQASFITYMNVYSNPVSRYDMIEPIEIDNRQNEVEIGDVFFTTSSETPEEVGMTSVLAEKKGITYLNSFCFGFRPFEKIDKYYLAYMLRSKNTREKIILLAQGISRYNISKNKVMEISVELPSFDEQILIGEKFKLIDHLITLHQLEPYKLIFKAIAYRIIDYAKSKPPRCIK